MDKERNYYKIEKLTPNEICACRGCRYHREKELVSVPKLGLLYSLHYCIKAHKYNKEEEYPVWCPL